MKRRASISLTVVAAVSLAAGRQLQLDPCEAASFNEQACQAAISDPRVLLEWAMGLTQISLSLTLLLRRLSGILGERRCGERSPCRILRPSFPCRLWISRRSVRRVRSD